MPVIVTDSCISTWWEWIYKCLDLQTHMGLQTVSWSGFAGLLVDNDISIVSPNHRLNINAALPRVAEGEKQPHLPCVLETFPEFGKPAQPCVEQLSLATISHPAGHHLTKVGQPPWIRRYLNKRRKRTGETIWCALLDNGSHRLSLNWLPRQLQQACHLGFSSGTILGSGNSTITGSWHGYSRYCLPPSPCIPLKQRVWH